MTMRDVGVGAVVAALFAACAILILNSLWQARPKHVARQAQAAAAVVNGETIYNKEVDAGLDTNMFGDMFEQARTQRLQAMIDAAMIRQYLQKQHVDIPAEEVGKQIADMRRNPPAMGCMCCRFATLEAFLAATMMTMDDLRTTVSNTIGIKQEVDKMWDNEHPAGEKRNALLAQERARFERSHIRLSHVFFNIAQQNDLVSDPSNVVERAKEKATEALSRLHRGEKFEAVAAACSEDRVSGPTGGDLGCVPRNAFGREVEEAIRQLKPDEVSQPVVSPWGVHILRRVSLTDVDVLKALQEEYANKTMTSLLDCIRREAKVEVYK